MIVFNLVIIVNPTLSHNPILLQKKKVMFDMGMFHLRFMRTS